MFPLLVVLILVMNNPLPTYGDTQNVF